MPVQAWRGTVPANSDDLQGIVQLLAQRPVPGVNVHPEPQGLRPSYIAEQTIEPIPFGSMADPVSQVAFLGAPALLRGTKALLETAAQPGPRLPGILGERGNLGPVPRSQGGEPLPGSRVRTPEGKLQRLYHGTGRAYEDFATREYSSGAGGDLYGPGIYMTDSPQIAGEYAQKGARVVREYVVRDQPASAMVQTLRQQGIPLHDPRITIGQTGTDARGNAVFSAWRVGQEGANIRPVYADLKKPLEMEAPAEPGLVRKLDELEWDYYLKPDGTPDIPTNKDLYKVLLRNIGDKAEVNDWLAANGYDGITHIGGGVTGGQPHRVYIAFQPEQVYPAVNVEGGY